MSLTIDQIHDFCFPGNKSRYNDLNWFEIQKKEFHTVDINSFNQMSGVSYLYLFICPPMELFKIGVSGNIPQRLDTISKPYVKEYGPGYRWICLGNLAVSDMHIARVENRFHSKFRFEFQVEEDSLYKSSEIYKLDKSIDFLAKLFFETADSLFAE